MYDMKKLGNLATINKSAPAATKAFWAFNEAAFADGALDRLTKELIALGVALTTQCPYCIELHTKAAREAGATDAQLSEAAMVAAAIRAGGAVTHATHMFEG
ncbi:alkylhydroperoxidase [Neoasaia chiangmaiensis NBRC 101099]|uniref:Alkylhydroperoxidase n=1 Tax=Neoasaia chiangmaiensis TaxID=320497 RepID=A0A1U9KTA7_9PROT|nr:carboxymuconolactone decarboxylase family protein [Neoasaia chiangmaiensis]AQS88910.1 alkylhydroperoxidase [Neoasaia chiangmaiensis]GBR40428.1 alkylhydroperoxidase [Neoasaia chiangmaiensis NBRC 101099]GEN13904.1 alkyl hydroperoxide reductase AhpD [Neoasaia chiangmaiensis]